MSVNAPPLQSGVPLYCPFWGKDCRWSSDTRGKTGTDRLEVHLRVCHPGAKVPAAAVYQDSSGGRAVSQSGKRGPARRLPVGAPDAQGPGMGARTPAPPPRHLTPWTAERIIEAIQAWAATHGGEPPTTSDWQRSGPGHPAMSTVHKKFGSWNAAIAAAGLQSRSRGGARDTRVTREQAIAALQAVAEDLGHAPSAKKWKLERRRPAQDIITKLFGSWPDACTAAGLTSLQQTRSGWTAEQITAAIQAWVAANGRPPTSLEWQQATPEHPSTFIVQRAFGSWAAGIEAAGYPRPTRSTRTRSGCAATGPVTVEAHADRIPDPGPPQLAAVTAAGAQPDHFAVSRIRAQADVLRTQAAELDELAAELEQVA